MASDSFSWDLAGSSRNFNSGDRLPVDVTVARFALSYIAVPFGGRPAYRFSAVNLHPDTWNSFMFPYGGIKVDPPAGAVSTFDDLADALRRAIEMNWDAYIAKARDELTQYFTVVPELDQIPAIYQNFSLKFSKSALEWTAYVFTYHCLPEKELLLGDMQAKQISLSGGSTRVPAEQISSDVALEENVRAFSESDIVKLWRRVYGSV